MSADGMGTLAAETRADDWPLRHAAALRLVEAACRHGSFTHAARELNVSHPAVSAAVARIEVRLGAPLFTRTGMGMRPTEAALDLARAYRAAESLVGRAWSRGCHPAEAVRLRVAVPAVLVAGWLSPRLKALPPGLPGLKITCHPPNSAPDFAQCDVALLLANDLSANLNGEALWEERLTPVCAPLSLAQASDVMALRRIVHDPRAWRSWELVAGVDRGRRRSNDILVDEPAVAVSMALAGQGMALASLRNVRHWLDAGQLTAPFDAELDTGQTLFAAWPREVPGTPEIHGFVDWLKQEAACELMPGLADAPSPTVDLDRA